MSRGTIASRVLASVAVLLVAYGGILLSSGASASGPVSGEVVCLPTWGVVVHGQAPTGGGEAQPDDEKVDAACRSAAQDRFDTAVTSGAVGGVVAVLAVAAAVVGRWRRHGAPSSRPSPWSAR